MKMITESYLRELFKGNNNKFPSEIEIGEYDKLTPAAHDFLSVRHIKIIRGGSNSYSNDCGCGTTSSSYKCSRGEEYGKPLNKDEWTTPEKYQIFYTKEIVDKKPESMTHLFENMLVYKDDPRIVLRGRLDTFMSKIVDVQVVIAEKHPNHIILNELSEILDFVRHIVGSEITNRPFDKERLLGLTESEIHSISHDPFKYFGLKQMIMVNYNHGIVASKLNLLRAEVREIELVAVTTYRNGDKIERNDLIQAFNRLSSIFHILMYREIAGKKGSLSAKGM